MYLPFIALSAKLTLKNEHGTTYEQTYPLPTVIMALNFTDAQAGYDSHLRANFPTMLSFEPAWAATLKYDGPIATEEPSNG